jgi:hypothetical protein
MRDITSTKDLGLALGLDLSNLTISQATRIVHDDFGSGAWGDTSAFLSLRRNLANLSGSQNTPLIIQTRALGTRTVSDRVNGAYVYLADSTSVTNKTITGAANNGSGLAALSSLSPAPVSLAPVSEESPAEAST